MDEIAFGTDGWRATLDTFTDRRVRIVGQAVADYLREEGEADRTVAVGYDARETSRGFAESLARVLCANGFDALLPERDTPTPVVAWTVADCPGDVRDGRRDYGTSTTLPVDCRLSMCS